MSAAYYKVHGRTLASAPGDDMSSTEIRRPDASGSEYVQKVKLDVGWLLSYDEFLMPFDKLADLGVGPDGIP